MAEIDIVVDSRGGSQPLPRTLSEPGGRGLVVDRFEYLSTGDERSLLRVAARFDAGGGGALAARRTLAGARLLIGGDGDSFRLDSLPDPGAIKPLPESGLWLWRAGFVVPQEVVKSRRTVFAIEADDDVLLELPRPAQLRMPEPTTRKGLAARVVAGARGPYMLLVGGLLAAALAPLTLPSSPLAQSSDDPPQCMRLDEWKELPEPERDEDKLCAEDRDELRRQEEAKSESGSSSDSGKGGDQAKDPSSSGSDGTPSSSDTSETHTDASGQEQDPHSDEGEEQQGSGDDEKVDRPGDRRKKDRKRSNGGAHRSHGHDHSPPRRTPRRNSDGSPTRSNPGFFDALPGPSKGVPNFVIRKFRVPVFLLPIYQAAGIQYGVRWEVLAAINEIETDYGRNLNVSSAGALGWMQFMPATWRAYGVDANEDGRKDPYNPVDAIFAAARYLKAAGADRDIKRAIFAYNHANWYVDSVMMRARLIAGVPSDVTGSLTGLTEGRFPVAARARYADDIDERDAERRVVSGRNAANVVGERDGERGIDIFAREGAPVVAVQDSVVKKVGRSEELGNYVVIQDVYGNRYTYAHLGSTAKMYPALKEDKVDVDPELPGDDPAPTRPATAGRQGEDRPKPRPKQAVKQRLFAHPNRPRAYRAGGAEQVVGSPGSYKEYFARPVSLDSRKMELRRFRKGARLIGGTIIGRIGRTVEGKAPHIRFEIRPAGRGAPAIDPKPILDGWKLLEATAVYRANGKNALHGGGASIGQILLLPKPLLERRVLNDERIEIYQPGREDIRAGEIDRRVLATMAYLAESGMRPYVTSLKSGHSVYTTSGSVSHHSSGNAVDIAAINGIPMLGHQGKGSITEQAVRRLMLLQGTMEPAQIISLLDFGRNTISMGDHHDHIHVGFRPLFGDNDKLGKQSIAVLRPGQWQSLLDRLRKIDNPVVPRRASKYSLPARRHKGD
jgi:murein DD-endopeptidase MepM/ murein hydrolase activator NlpD